MLFSKQNLVQSAKAKNESGVVLILFAILLIPLILLVALTVDTARLSASHSQQRDISGFASLAALEGFVELDLETAGAGDTAIDPDDQDAVYNARLESAVLEAEKTINSQLNLLYGQRGETAIEAGKLYDPSGRVPDRNSPTDSIGIIIAGNWYYNEPTNEAGDPSCATWLVQQGSAPMDDSCPCPGGKWEGACFEANDDQNVNFAHTAGAFRIELQTQDDSPIKTIFAQVGGVADVKISSRSQATRTPRRGVFIVDLSRSMNFETHSEYRPGTGDTKVNAVDYAIRLNEDEACADDFTNECIVESSFLDSTFFTSPGTEPNCGMGTLQLLQWSDFYRDISGYDNLCETRPSNGVNFRCNDFDVADTTGGFYPRSRHFRDDYQCITLNVNEDANDTAVYESYLIDTDGLLGTRPSSLPRPHTLSDATSDIYRGPQPLTSVLGALNQALVTIEERSLKGDEIGVIFFDEAVEEIRVFPPDGGLTSPGQEEFEELLSITNVDMDDLPQFKEDLEKRLKSYIFPRTVFKTTVDPITSVTTTEGLGANTDLPAAMIRAAEMLGAGNVSGAADNFVAIFSDGLTNCSHSPPGGNQPNPDKSIVHDDFLIVDDGDVGVNTPEKLCEQDLDRNPVTRLNNYLVSSQEASSIASGFPESYTRAGDYRTFIEQEIAIHYFLVGSKVEPNSVVRPNSAGSACLGQDEAKELVVPYADGGEFPPDTDPTTAANLVPGSDAHNYASGQYDGDEFRFPNYLSYATLVGPTNGTWAPIRPPCNPSDYAAFTTPDDDTMTRAQCREGDLVAALDLHCAQTAMDNTDNSIPTHTLVVPDIPGIIEGGALICDPLCRETEESSAASVEDIYADNPYVLVESRKAPSTQTAIGN